MKGPEVGVAYGPGRRAVEGKVDEIRVSVPAPDLPVVIVIPVEDHLVALVVVLVPTILILDVHVRSPEIVTSVERREVAVDRRGRERPVVAQIGSERWRFFLVLPEAANSTEGRVRRK